MLISRATREPFRPPSASARLAVVVCCAVVLTLVPGARLIAAAGMPSLPARSLALPRSAFPAGAHVVRTSPTSAQLTAISGLHTQPLASFGWLAGSLQTAIWQVTAGRQRNQVTMRYSASTYGTAQQAAGAYGDALASLWEIGETMEPAPAGMPGVAFLIHERHYTQIDLVLHSNVVAAELRVRFGKTASSKAKSSALLALQRASQAADRRLVQLTRSLPAPAASSSLPPIFAPPIGAGPIAKSPSLMVMTGSLTDPGAFRNTAPSAPLGKKTLAPFTLVPAAELARFVRTAYDAAGRISWYNSTTIYVSPADAATALHTLQTANAVQPQVSVPAIAGTNEAAMWRLGGETVLAYRTENLVTVLAGSGATPDAVVSAASRLMATVPTWLHAQGTQIVDALGQPVHLACLNWYGAEQQDFVVGGLDYQSYQSILETTLSLGYTCLRIPFSDQLVEQNPVVTNHVLANPALAGLPALSILDRVIQYAGALGMRVILDNHRSEAGWSSEENGLWYTAQYPDAAFVHDWFLMASRYAATNTVIGADLRNEPHATATWGDGNPATDWRAAAQRAGNTVLGVSPHLLIIVEGIQFYGNGPGGWWGGNLMGVASAPVELQFSDGSSARSQLVYSAHDYGPNNCGSGCPWFNSSTTYASLAQIWDQYFGYIAADPSKPYAAPVWVGEFGTCNFQQQCVSDSTPGSQGQWFSSLIRYLGERHLSWAYWSLNGTQSTGGQRTYGSLEFYGLLQKDWSAPTPWVHNALQGIVQDPTAPPPA